ncbi:MAG: polysaccharide biosynthesis C-terminal domain-containing protein [Bacteroidales bacterium]|jgi:O-antigen/teichoic acid export membrane protein|nr:polysaccharide biosynthesis C-terminal domain-containing protein [Bacteroidales bacterium]
MSKYSRLGKNTLLVFVGNAGSKLIGLLMLPFYTRWLSVEDYGTTDIINVYVSLLLGLSTACIAEAIFIFPKGQSVENQKKYFSSGLFFSFITLIITAFLFKIIDIIFKCNEIVNSFTDNLGFIYGLLIATFIQQYIQQFTRSIDKIKVYSITGIVSTVATAVFSFFMIPQWGVFGYVAALIFANLSASIYSFLFSGSYKYLSIKVVRKNICFDMLKYSIPLIPNVIMWWIVSAFNRPLMENYLGMHDIGIFAVANKFPGILSMLFSVFTISWQISVLEEFEKEGYSVFFNKIFRFLIFGLMCLFFITTIFSKLIVSFFTTIDFYDAWKYIPVLVLGVIFSSISGFAGSNFLATRESKYFFYSSIWGAGTAILFNLILIPKFGIMGAAISISVSFAIMAVTRIIYGWRYVKILNIMRYLLMLLIGILLIGVYLNMQISLIKCLLQMFLFILFLLINYDLKKEIKEIYLRLKKYIIH